MTLSVYILAIGDYSDCIEKALKSAVGAEEIVVQAGKDQKTIDIAKKYTDKIFTDYEWKEDGGEARNHAIKHCTKDWILELDVDNELEDIEKVKKIITMSAHDVLSVELTNREHTHYHNLPLLFRNDPKYFYVGSVHEILNTTAQAGTNIKIYTGTSTNKVKDPKRNIRRLLNSLEKERKPREMFYLGREYCDNKMYYDAVYWLDEYLKYGTWLPEVMEAYYYKALSLWKINKGDEAREACLKAIQINPDCQKVLYLMGEMYYEPRKSKWNLLARIASNHDVLFV